MKVSRACAAANREKVLAVAAGLFRERGFAGTSVADIMQAAGLTHGGFYGHFASKDALAAEVSAGGLFDGAGRWEALVRDDPQRALATVLGRYLSPQHRDAPGAGCGFAALGPEVARQAGAVRGGFTAGLRERLRVLAEMVPGESAAGREARAMATMAGMVGALMLARAVDDPVLSDAILGGTAGVLGAG